MKCCDTELDFKLAGGIEEEIHIAKCYICNTIYYQKMSQPHAYKSNGEDFICTRCESDIRATTIAHPIHDGPFALSGSGKCDYEIVPYCPKCETKPSFHGKILTVKNKFS